MESCTWIAVEFTCFLLPSSTPWLDVFMNHFWMVTFSYRYQSKQIDVNHDAWNAKELAANLSIYENAFSHFMSHYVEWDAFFELFVWFGMKSCNKTEWYAPKNTVICDFFSFSRHMARATTTSEFKFYSSSLSWVETLTGRCGACEWKKSFNFEAMAKILIILFVVVSVAEDLHASDFDENLMNHNNNSSDPQLSFINKNLLSLSELSLDQLLKVQRSLNELRQTNEVSRNQEENDDVLESRMMNSENERLFNHFPHPKLKKEAFTGVEKFVRWLKFEFIARLGISNLKFPPKKNRVRCDGKSLGQQAQQDSNFLSNQHHCPRLSCFRRVFALYDCSGYQEQRYGMPFN